MKKNILFRLMLLAVLSIPLSLQAQVTVGSDIPATRGALLELKTKQTTGTVPSVSDDGNITADDGDGGFLLPKVKLVDPETLEPFIAVDDPEFVNNTNSLKEKLAGLMVYNLSSISGLLPGICVWDGSKWNTTQPPISISVQPQKFTFYETLVSGAIDPISVSVNGGVAPITYQWYQVTGNNVHVRIGSPMTVGTGPKTPTYTPTQIKISDGDTRVASRAGFYRYYCVVTDAAGQKVESDIAEIAVGCGAKNNAGEWFSFMCFNLGADNNSTIASQKAYTFSGFANDADGTHTYQTNEESLFGDLFQWGRIPDGHEKRQSSTETFIGMTAVDDIVNGKRCLIAEDYQHPYQQVSKTSIRFGKFITSVSANNYNWTPVIQSSADQLWHTGRFVQNDPCAHYKEDGSYQEFWHEGTNETADSDACIDAGTGWRLPDQQEWGDIYRGGSLTGTPNLATANTWKWLNGNSTPITNSRGFEIQPDGATTTLFLPACGFRGNGGNALLYYQGAGGQYWSSAVSNTNAFNLSFYSGTVYPATSNYRARGFAVRCIKN